MSPKIYWERRGIEGLDQRDLMPWSFRSFNTKVLGCPICRCRCTCVAYHAWYIAREVGRVSIPYVIAVVRLYCTWQYGISKTVGELYTFYILLPN
jgi:hypothetical protein